jgi:hypothetical protein
MTVIPSNPEHREGERGTLLGVAEENEDREGTEKSELGWH